MSNTTEVSFAKRVVKHLDLSANLSYAEVERIIMKRPNVALDNIANEVAECISAFDEEVRKDALGLAVDGGVLRTRALAEVAKVWLVSLTKSDMKASTVHNMLIGATPDGLGTVTGLVVEFHSDEKRWGANTSPVAVLERSREFMKIIAGDVELASQEMLEELVAVLESRSEVANA